MNPQKYKYVGLGIGALAVLFAASWIPISIMRQYSLPRAEDRFARPVYGDKRTVAQQFQNHHAIHTVEISVRGLSDYTSTLVVTDEKGVEVGHTQLQLAAADQWAAISINPPITYNNPLLIFTSSDASAEQPVLIRYQPQSDIYPDGTMWVNGKESHGDIGFRAFDRVPIWESVLIWGQVTPVRLYRQSKVLMGGLLIGAVLYLFSRRAPSRRVLMSGFIGLGLAALLIRVPYLTSIEGVFGGDAFNYLSKTQALLEGRDPFATDFRKGPLYSLLLIPGFLTADPLYWSRLVGIAAAVAVVLLLPLLGRHFKLGWPTAVGAGLLLAVNQDFIWESPSGLANTLYVALIVASILMYVKAHTLRTQVWLAVLLGLTFLTRYEGITIAAVLLPALWWREKFSWKRALGLAAITGALIALPQMSLLWSGQSGIRTFGDIQSDDGLFLVRSIEDLGSNAEKFYTFIYSTWLVPEEGYTTVYVGIAAAVGVLLGALLTWLHSKATIKIPYEIIVASLAVLMVVSFTILGSSESRVFLIALPWLFIGLGLPAFFRARPFDATVIFLLFVVQAIVIFIILPKPRYFLPLLPFYALCMALGIDLIVRWRASAKARFASFAVIGILATVLYVDGHASLLKRQEKYNVQAHHVNVMLLAVDYLRSQQGAIGFHTGQEQTIETFIPANRRYYFDGPVEDELAWIRNNNISYAVERDDESIWQSAHEYPDVFQHVRTFETKHGEDKVLLYRIDPAKLPPSL